MWVCWWVRLADGCLGRVDGLRTRVAACDNLECRILAFRCWVGVVVVVVLVVVVCEALAEGICRIRCRTGLCVCSLNALVSVSVCTCMSELVSEGEAASVTPGLRV